MKGLKGEIRVEENICKTFKKLKARQERDHRLKLQQCAAVMEMITRSEANRKLALWTSDHPVFTLPLAQSGRAEVVDFFQRGLPEVRQRSSTGRSWEVRNAIRTYFFAPRLIFCDVSVVFSILVDFSVWWAFGRGFLCRKAQWVAPVKQTKNLCSMRIISDALKCKSNIGKN